MIRCKKVKGESKLPTSLCNNISCNSQIGEIFKSYNNSASRHIHKLVILSASKTCGSCSNYRWWLKGLQVAKIKKVNYQSKSRPWMEWTVIQTVEWSLCLSFSKCSSLLNSKTCSLWECSLRFLKLVLQTKSMEPLLSSISSSSNIQWHLLKLPIWILKLKKHMTRPMAKRRKKQKDERLFSNLVNFNFKNIHEHTSTWIQIKLTKAN